MGPFDFFIAHAGPDHRQARRLYWFLKDQGCEVFLDKKGLFAGSQWPSELHNALLASRATVVLISSNTDTAFYQHEEIAQAIQRSRDDPHSHTVIPVILEKLPAGLGGMPYGTGILQALDATREDGLERVADELADLLSEWDRNATQQPILSAGNYQALGAALRLDRYPQWSGVLKESGRHGHILFLLHGPRQQNVALFVERIQRYLSQEIRHHHAVYRVRFKSEGVAARCGADWLRHLRLALGGEGDNRQSLARAARDQALFLILGLRPLDRLDSEQQEGLRELIEGSLPALLRDARPNHDVRILLALDYEDTALQGDTLPPLVKLADAWGRTARASGQLHYRLLPPVKLPAWDDVEDYISNNEPYPPAEVITELKKEYERLRSGRTLSYQELADLVDRYLQDA